VTSHACDDSRDAVWAVDLTAETPKPVSYALPPGGSAFEGPAIGPDGTVYLQTADAVLALGAKDLRLKHSFKLASDGETGPIVVVHQDRTLIAAGGKDGRLHLLDAESMEPLLETSSLGASFTGSLATWQDTEGVAWILAPVRGPAAANGTIRAFKLEEQNGKLALTPAWTSRDMNSPQGPVIAGGVVFALSSGGPHATLFALDAETGKELYSSGEMVTAPASPTGMTVANGRVYFGAMDGTVYCFGMYMEH
jgi:outer membrane protein assembly factor BamB